MAVFINGTETKPSDRIQTVAAATDTVLPNRDLILVTFSSTNPVTDLEVPVSVISQKIPIMVKDTGGRAGTNNITLKTTADAVIGVITEDYGSLILVSDGTTISLIE